MSADTEISNLLSHATTATSSLASQSAALVDAATAAIAKTVTMPTWNPNFGTSIGVDYGESGVPGFAGAPWTPSFEIPQDPPTAFPAWPILTFAEAPDTQDLDTVTDRIEVEFPDLTLPSFTGYRTVGELAAFAKSAPIVDTGVNLPDSPDGETAFAPTLLSPRTIDASISIDVSAPDLLPVTTSFSTAGLSTVYSTALSQFRGSIEGDINPLLASVSAWSDDVLTGVLPAALDALLARMTTPEAPVLAAGAHAALTASLSRRLTEERTRVEAIVADDRSGWDLPTAVRLAMAATLEQVRQTQFQKTQAGFYTKTIELALALFEVYGSLLAGLSGGVAKLYEKAIELLLDTHRQSLAAAKQTVESLLKLHDLVYVKAQELNLDVAEAKLQVAEQQLTAALVAFEVAKLQLEAEEAKQEVDSIAIRILRANVQKADSDAKLFATQVSSVRAELDAIKLPGDVFKMQVQAFSSRIDAHQAQVECRVAEIDGDAAKMEGKLLAVKEYESRATAFEKTIAAKSQISQSQAERNAAVLAEFEARVKGVLAPLEQTALTDQYELQKYSVLADNVLTDARIAEKNARARLQFAINKQDAIREAFRFSQERAIDLMKSELARVEAIASANETGAGIMASMATSAMSSANAIAHTIITESA